MLPRNDDIERMTMAEYPIIDPDPTVRVLAGDCLAVLRTLPDSSVHAVVTDPPYGLSEVSSGKLTTALTAWVNGDRESVPDGRGFMGKAWDAFVPPPAVWDECLRVLAPGGHMLVFAGSRTVDLMGLSIRLAGFEIRDTLQWLYGSGFPKSHDVSKALDKLAGAEREIVGAKSAGASSLQRVSRVDQGYRENLTQVTPASIDVTAPATDAAREWEGWGTALKPAAEPIILARKPLESTVARNVLAHGVGGLNIDGCRVATTDRWSATGVQSAPGDAYQGSVDGSLNISVSSTHEAGRFPANVILSHSETCTDDVCDEGCPVAELDAQSGVSESKRADRGAGKGETQTFGVYGDNAERVRGHEDSGGASRFFPTFRYQAKAPKSERPKVDGVSHPTVKPLTLMRWLVRLVTPPGGTVLDPFAGTGTTLQAARDEGFPAIGVEREQAYLPLIEQRTGMAAEHVAAAEPEAEPTDTAERDAIVAQVIDVAARFPTVPGVQPAHEAALAAESVAEATAARDALRDALVAARGVA